MQEAIGLKHEAIVVLMARVLIIWSIYIHKVNSSRQNMLIYIIVLPSYQCYLNYLCSGAYLCTLLPLWVLVVLI